MEIAAIFSKPVKEKFTKKLLFVYAIILIFLFFFFRKFGSQGMIEFLKQVNLQYVLVAGLLFILAIFVRAYRLYLMLLKVKKVKWRNTLLIQVIAQTISIYTIGIAESIKTLPLKKLEKIPAKKSLEIFVLEKTFDMFANAAILILALPYLEAFFPSLAGKLFNVSAILLVGIIVAGFYLFETRYKKIEIEYALFVLGITFANMLAKLGAVFFIFTALGINLTIELLFVVYAILSIIPMISIVPFGLGIKEPLIVFFAQVTVGMAESGAFTLLTNLVVFVSYTILSVLFLIIYSREK